MIRTLIFLATLLPMAHTPVAHAQQTLASYVDRNRILLVFAPSDKDPRYTQQLTLLEHHAADLKERDLLVLPILLQQGPPITPDTLRVTLGPGLPDQEQILARRRFHIAPTGFTAILIGKDGGEKLTSHQPVTVGRLNRLIDAMPMRQDEMRNKP